MLIAADSGNTADVEAWLNAGNDVNDVCADPYQEWTLLLVCVNSGQTRTASHIALTRLLLERGANVNVVCLDQGSEMHILNMNCDNIDTACLEVASLLLESGANVNARSRVSEDEPYETSLGIVLDEFRKNGPSEDSNLRAQLVTILLRAGASLDNISDDGSAEDILRAAETELPEVLRDDAFIAIRDLVASVRAAGSWKAHCRLAHKQVLRLRSLVARGRAKLPRARRRSPRSRDARQKRALEFLMRQGDNGIVWNILSFWRATV